MENSEKRRKQDNNNNKNTSAMKLNTDPGKTFPQKMFIFTYIHGRGEGGGCGVF